MKTKTTMLALAAAALLTATTAVAQTFPDRPLTIIQPYGAGSLPDTLTRSVAELMRQTLGQPIVVENRVGAGGAMGAAAGSRAQPDGYTITMIGSPHAAAMFTMSNPGFDLEKDFEPVGGISEFVNLYTVTSKRAEIKTIADLIAYAKANPGKLNFATSGPSTPGDLGASLFAKVHSIEITKVPYRGSPQAITAVVAGESDVVMVQAGALLPHVQSGALRALAVAGPRRWNVLPDVPNADESGAKVYMPGQIGLVVPKGTPKDRIAILNKALNTALADKTMQERAVTGGGVVSPGTPEALTATIRRELADARESVAAAGIQKQ